MKHFKILAVLIGFTLFLVSGPALAAEPRAIPPNMIGLILTPKGYDGKVYLPGQTDIGRESWSGYGNQLVLMPRSGYYIKEQFLEHVDGDKSDHRCIVGPDREPMVLDVRLLFAMPDPKTEAGRKAILRMGLLGNPVPHPHAKQLGGNRVMILYAESVYQEQVRNQVRGKIRDVCLSYGSVEEVYAALEKNGTGAGFSDVVQQAVAQVLADNDSPLLLVTAVVSNAKPDPAVVQAIVARKAAEQLVLAMGKIDDFIKEDPSGQRAYIFKMMVMQNMMAGEAASTMFMTDVSQGQQVVPLPVQ